MMGTRSAAALRHPVSIGQAEAPRPPSLARIYIEAAERHRQRGDSPKLIAALVRAAWRLNFGG
ncbi:MAG: hypothetical protein HYY06_28300 [Deltaproteobacteria bacterium]|nr:hypothetical protein [Deltaproteobacteria bacterium]